MLGQFIAGNRVRELVTQARGARAQWLNIDERAFRAGYNRHPFLVRHRLAEHPMFEFAPLAALCRRLPADQVRYRFGVVPADAHFDSSLVRFRGELTLDDALDRMEDKQAYIAVYNPERDPLYRPIIDGLLGELAAHSEQIEPGINWYSTYIFLSAHGSITPYHMDREMNFLLQIRGTKTAKLWDPMDPEVMTPAQKDVLLARHDEPRPIYTPALDRKAMTFDLVPGVGVHHPFIAPHLVTTGPQLSISLAITFRTERSDMWTDAHRFNHRLRRQIGFAPVAVGRSMAIDAAKAGIVRLTNQVRRVLRRDVDAADRSAAL